MIGAAMTLSDAQEEFERIYGAVNEARFGIGITRGISSMWLQVVKQAGEVARAIRKERKDLLLRELPQLFCWYCGFCTKIGLGIEDTVWFYFPLLCPTCYSERCICGPHKEVDLRTRPRQKDRNVLKEFGAANAARRPHTLDDYVEMFDTIYGDHNEAAHMDSVFLHLMEELGEVARWIHIVKKANTDTQDQYVKNEMASELADVFSWICKLVARANAEYHGFRTYLGRLTKDEVPIALDIRLSELVRTEYGSGCPECGGARCSSSCPGWTLGKGLTKTESD